MPHPRGDIPNWIFRYDEFSRRTALQQSPQKCGRGSFALTIRGAVIESRNVENAQTRIDFSLPLLEAVSSRRWASMTEIGLFKVVGSLQPFTGHTLCHRCRCTQTMRSLGLMNYWDFSLQESLYRQSTHLRTEEFLLRRKIPDSNVLMNSLTTCI
jgi:hypothetical protein